MTRLPALCLAVCLACLAVALAPVRAYAATPDLRATNLRCEYLVDPVGVDAQQPRLSWIVESPARGQEQSAYRIVVASSPAVLRQNRGDLWDTGKVASHETAQIAYAGKPLASCQVCWWKVQVWDAGDAASDWSAPSSWTMGLLQASDWTGKWIGAAPEEGGDPVYRPAAMLRHTFQVKGAPARALLIVTAAGLYQAHVNGKRVGDDYLAPGWTEYGKRTYYRMYDVTALLRKDAANAIGFMLGDGWYGLHHGGRGKLAILAQLRLVYPGGKVEQVVTDEKWKTTLGGPIRMADIYNGETYDARREIAGWATAGFDDSTWTAATIRTDGPDRRSWRDVTDRVRAAVRDGALRIAASNTTMGGDPIYGIGKSLRVSFHLDGASGDRTASENETLVLGPAASPGGLVIDKAEYGADAPADPVVSALRQAHPGPPVRKTGEVRTVSVKQPKPGVFVYDLGQNIVGWVRLKVRGEAGTQVTLRFTEMLNPDGTVYTTNLRHAKCTDQYTLRGGGVETWEPRFTFHGFRYVEVTGFPGPPGPDAVTGVVLCSDNRTTADWVSSDARLNRLYQNIVWGQRGNYLEVPTDCPQRDERMGWTGDAQAFIPTGAYNQDVAAFFTAWLRTFCDCQTAEGGFPNVAPKGWGVSPGWGDAGIICPWTVYRHYGDTRILAEHYEDMARWIEYLRVRSSNLIRPAEGFGDWLNVGDETPKEVISTAYFAHVTSLMSQIATVLGKTEDAAKYDALAGRIRAAFNQTFVGEDGRIRGDNQAGYVLALAFDILTPANKAAASKRLVELIAARHDHLSVGFLGVPVILPVLTEIGRTDLAWKLMMNDTYPSWLYEVKNGATTIWERWDGWTTDKGFQTPAMNSFNHYAFGSCGQWMFETAAGIAARDAGYRELVIRPRPGGGITSLKAHYDSVRGRIATAWTTAAGKLRLDVTIPANASAEVWVPAASAEAVSEGSGPASQAAGVRFLRAEDGCAIFGVGSGHYTFSAPLAR